jgi:hypothetical protein
MSARISAASAKAKASAYDSRSPKPSGIIVRSQRAGVAGRTFARVVAADETHVSICLRNAQFVPLLAEEVKGDPKAPPDWLPPRAAGSPSAVVGPAHVSCRFGLHILFRRDVPPVVVRFVEIEREQWIEDGMRRRAAAPALHTMFQESVDAEPELEVGHRRACEAKQVGAGSRRPSSKAGRAQFMTTGVQAQGRQARFALNGIADPRRSRAYRPRAHSTSFMRRATLD